MEDIHRTHKEPAWGWIGALLESRKPASPATAQLATKPTPALRPSRAGC